MLYKKAPIQEAVLDIRVTEVENTDLEHYKRLPLSIKNFPQFEKFINLNQINIDLKENKNTTTSTLLIGAMFSYDQGTRKVQFRKDGFTINYLQPYTKWEDLLDVASLYWTIYKKEIKPRSIQRIALRYINKIDLPNIEGLDFDDYFQYMPSIPKNLPQILNAFYLQMNVPCGKKENGITANLTLTIQPPTITALPFILDIDVIKESNFRTDFDPAIEFFELRKIKNEIFESYITDKTRQLFA